MDLVGHDDCLLDGLLLLRELRQVYCLIWVVVSMSDLLTRDVVSVWDLEPPGIGLASDRLVLQTRPNRVASDIWVDVLLRLLLVLREPRLGRGVNWNA